MFALEVDPTSNEQTFSRRKESGNLPNAVTVYEKGAVFDVADGNTLQVNAPLVKPEGNGVVAITLPLDEMNAAGFILPPRLRLSGGGGSGASAFAHFDSRTRKVTGVEITSPGFGYTSAPTVEVLEPVKEGGVWTLAARFTGTATIAPNVTTGGVTKHGAGKMKLGVQNAYKDTSSDADGNVVVTEWTSAFANTFGGALRIEEGTVEFASVGALPAGNDITVKSGATLKASGFVLTPDTLCVGGSDYTISAASVTPKKIRVEESCMVHVKYLSEVTGWIFTADALRAGAQATITSSGAVSLAKLSEIVFVDGDRVDVSIPHVLVTCENGFVNIPETVALTGLPKPDSACIRITSTEIKVVPRGRGMVIVIR